MQSEAKQQWTYLAIRAAGAVHDHHRGRARGVMHLCLLHQPHWGLFPPRRSSLGIYAVWGNCGHHHDRVRQREARLLRGLLRAYGIPILGYGVGEPERASWAYLVEIGEPDVLHNLLEHACHQADRKAATTPRRRDVIATAGA